jgi:hypothetical protein
MINATLYGYEKKHLENVDINRLAERGAQSAEREVRSAEREISG